MLATKRTPDFKESGEYEIIGLVGPTRYIYWSPDCGWWYEARLNEHYTFSFRGFNRVEALARMGEMYGIK